MGGDASSSIGSADHHGIRDMKSMGADNRPTEWDEDTNRKSMFPAPKTLHICLMPMHAVPGSQCKIKAV